MNKKILVLLVVSVLFFACGNKDKSKQVTSDEVKQEKVKVEEAVKITVDDFKEKAESLVGKKVIIAGTVVHVCEHSGKRMHIINTDPDFRVKIESGKILKSFDKELNGSEVLVTGIVKEMKVDETFLANWEKELNEGKKETGTHDGDNHGKEEKVEEAEHDHDSEAQKKEDGLKKIENYRKKITESKKGYISLFSIECESFKVIEKTEK